MAYSSPKVQSPDMKFAPLAFASGLIFIGSAADAAEPAKERVCYSVAETRAKIAMHQLTEPFRVMRAAASRYQAEALNAKLCRWSEDLVYEISLLRRDGHVIHIFMNATNGQIVGSRNEH
jgi:uncharacterized membrane protein YkoI